MSSHREAPEISKDPVADSTDVYAFVSPDRPDTVTLITNYIPLEDPAGGPNFFEFGDDVLYRINIDNNGDGRRDVTYEFRFSTRVGNPNSFLYNTGQIATIDDPAWNRKQFYSLTRVTKDKRGRASSTLLGTNLPCPPCNIGPRSTPNYAALGNAAIVDFPDGTRSFAGQRLDGFYVDLGSIFDLGALRPFQNLHLINMPGAAPGVNALRSFNVHTLAVQVPIGHLTGDGSTPTDPMSAPAVIGVWASASRRKATILDPGNRAHQSGPYVQVSRLGNPLFNEVIVPMGDKDRWNKLTPDKDYRFAKYVAQPELAKLLPFLYPGVFPNLAARTADRADLLAILLTGIPAGIIPGFQNFTGATQADELRLNVAIPPTPKANMNILGLLGGDLAGFPNGRRVQDDITTVELRAVAGATIPLVDPTYTVDAAASLISDGTATPVPLDGTGGPPATVSYLDTFPFLDHPQSGYETVPLGAGAQ
jgi:Domain of unknown function (DUF4331)